MRMAWGVQCDPDQPRMRRVLGRVMNADANPVLTVANAGSSETTRQTFTYAGNAAPPIPMERPPNTEHPQHRCWYRHGPGHPLRLAANAGTAMPQDAKDVVVCHKDDDVPPCLS